MSLVGRCDPELDLGTKMGSRRPKYQSSHNGFKTNVSVDLVDMNPIQLEWAQTDIVCSRYRNIFVLPNRQNVNSQQEKSQH
jgi:hypothetical protein